VKRIGWLASLLVSIVLVLAVPSVAYPAQMKALHRGVLDPLATPVSDMPLTLDAQQAQEVAVLVDFLRAYNAGRVGTALTLFKAPWVWSDCDYRRGTVLAGQDKASLTRWLRQRSADHDRLDIGSIMVGTAQEEALGVTFKRRTSDTLRALGHPQGITPTLGAKVIFDGRSGMTARPSIMRFVNGPYGGSLDFCRVRS